MAAGNVGFAVWTQLRRSTPATRERSWGLGEVAVGDTYLFEYPSDDDPAILLRIGDREVVAFSQKCTHLGCVVYFESDQDRWHCPCHEGNFAHAPGPSSPGRHRDRSAG